MSVEVRGVCPLIQVFDMQISLHFWRDLLGFETVQSAGPEDDLGWVWLRRGTADVMLNTQYEMSDRPESKDPAREAAHADTTVYFGCPDVDGLCAELRSRGVKVSEPKVASYGMKQMYLRDPDGYGICFQWTANSE